MNVCWGMNFTKRSNTRGGAIGARIDVWPKPQGRPTEFDDCFERLFDMRPRINVLRGNWMLNRNYVAASEIKNWSDTPFPGG